MDAKALIAFRDGIMVEVRKMIDGKFKGSSEELSDDSKVAVQQLIGMNSALREEFSKLAAGAKVTASCVEELQKKVAALESTSTSSRTPADIANLKSSIVKIQEKMATDIATTQTSLDLIQAKTTKALEEVAKKASVSSPVVVNTPLPNAAPTTTLVLEAANSNDPNSGGGSVEIKTSDVNRRLTSLEGRIKAIPSVVPYDDSAILQRLVTVEGNVAGLYTRVNAVDLTPLQTSLASLEGKVTALSTKLDETVAHNHSNNSLSAAPSLGSLSGGLFGIGSPVSASTPTADITALKARVDALESQFAALVRVGVSKSEFDPLIQQFTALKTKVDMLNGHASGNHLVVGSH